MEDVKKPSMHPEIEKFWRDSDKSLGAYTSSQCQYWFIVSNPAYYNQGGPPPPLQKDMICIRWIGENGEWLKAYYFESKRYTEEEMLKIIKMKAFL